MPDLRTLLADAIGHALSTKPFEASGMDSERQVELAMADAAAAVFAQWLRATETGDLVAEATERHHITDQTDALGNNLCVCGDWADTADIEGWDQHLAYVGLNALADTLAPALTDTQETDR